MNISDLLSRSSNLAVGVAGGAAIEATHQIDTLIGSVEPSLVADGNPVEIVKVITQILIAIATLFSLFRKPKDHRAPKMQGHQ